MDLEAIEAYRVKQAQEQEEKAAAELAKKRHEDVVNTVTSTSSASQKATVGLRGEVIKSAQKVSGSVDKSSKETVKWLQSLVQAVEKVSKDIDIPSVEIPDSVTVKNFPKFPEFPKSLKVDNLSELKPYFKPLVDAIDKLPKSLKFDPQITVSPTPVKIDTKEVDLKPLLKALEALKSSPPVVNVAETDLSPVVKAVEKVNRAIGSLSFPVPNYVLPFKDVGGASVQSPMPFLSKPFDRLIVTYTNSDRTIIDTIVTKKNGVTQETITNTSTATVDDLQRV